MREDRGRSKGEAENNKGLPSSFRRKIKSVLLCSYSTTYDRYDTYVDD